MTLAQAKLLVYLILASTEGGWMSRSPAQLQELWTEVRRQKSLEAVWKLISGDEQWQVDNYLEVWTPKPVDVQYPPPEATAEVARMLAGAEIDTPQGGVDEAASEETVAERTEREGAQMLADFIESHAEAPEEAPRWPGESPDEGP